MALPNDPMFSQQWHLNNTTAGLFDLNIVDANGVDSIWDDYTGAGIDVFVIDDAFDYNHADLAANYDTTTDYDWANNDLDPFGTSSLSHGTAVMGIIGAVGDNGVGVTGVAYDATMVGYQIADLISDAWLQDIRDAIGWAGDNAGAEVINISQGIANDASSEFGNGYNAVRFTEIDNSIDEAVDDGRGGLGTVIVKSAGNSRSDNYDVNADPWTNNTHQVVVAAVDQNGFVSSYSSYGAANLVSALGSPLAGEVVTTDRTGSAGYNSTDYTSSFNGTSAAAPMVSGVVALMLEANASLGWRDVQDILAYSARHVGSAVDNTTTAGSERTPWDWNAANDWNGGGLHYSLDYGYGLVDAHAAVRMAETWLGTIAAQTSANEVSTFEDGLNSTVIIPDGNSTGTTFNIVETDSIIVERVTIEIAFSTTYLADMEIYLASPDGTEHLLIRDQAGSADFNGRYTFESQAFHGESSDGTWAVRIVDDAGGDTLTVTDIDLRTFGRVATSDDRFVFTNEYSDYDGVAGHTTAFNGGSGVNTINAAAVTSDTTIDLLNNSGTIDGVAITNSNINRVYTGDGNDTIIGDGVSTYLNGGRGNDTITSGSGDEELRGGEGNDTFRYNDGQGADAGEWLYGGTGTDKVELSSSSNATFDFRGFDVYSIEEIEFYAYDGSNVDKTAIFNAEEFDTSGEFATNLHIDGNNNTGSTDAIQIYMGAVTNLDISGWTFQDWGGQGETITIFGDSSFETITGSDAFDRIEGGLGNDTIYGGRAGDLLVAGGGDDHLYGDEDNDSLFGGDGRDWLEGGTGGDHLAGWTGDDLLVGGDGDDRLLGEQDNDELYGGNGRDWLEGGTGGDHLAGWTGDDLLVGGDGDDRLLGEQDNDELYGGNGRDWLDGGTGGDHLAGWTGDDLLVGGDGNDHLLGEQNDDELYGGNGGDWLEGGSGEDLLAGWTGIDYLYGGSGNDTLLGEQDNDVLFGGTGNDHLYGGAGGDTFMFDTSNWGNDFIYDFWDGIEKVGMSGSGTSAGSMHTTLINGNQDTLVWFDGISDTITFVGINSGIDTGDFVF